MRNRYGDELLEIIIPTSVWSSSDAEINSNNAIVGHIGAGMLDRIKRRSFNFTFLRDPVDRVLSHYYYWRNRASGKAQSGAHIAKQLSIEEFILNEEHPVVCSAVDNVQTWMLFQGTDSGTFVEFAGVSNEELLSKAKLNLTRLDFVGLTEHYSISVKKIYSDLSWGEPLHTKKNINSKRKFADDLDPAILEKLRDRVALDIKLYEYGQSLFNKQIG